MSEFDTPANCPGLVGLAMRAGALTLGEEGCLGAIRAGKAALIMIDEGVSPGTLKRFRDASEFHKVEMVILRAGQLARSVGKPDRRIAVVQEKKLAEAILGGMRKSADAR